MIDWTFDELKTWVAIRKPGWPSTSIAVNDRPTLDAAQEFVGGLVEMVPNQLRVDGEPIQILVNEEGLWKNLPVNPTASHMCANNIVGNAWVLVGKARWT